VEIVGAFDAEGRLFDSTSSHHVGTLGSPSPVIACMTDVAPCGCLAANIRLLGLLSSVHTLLVNILRCVRLYIKRKYYKYIINRVFQHLQ